MQHTQTISPSPLFTSAFTVTPPLSIDRYHTHSLTLSLSVGLMVLLRPTTCTRHVAENRTILGRKASMVETHGHCLQLPTLHRHLQRMCGVLALLIRSTYWASDCHIILFTKWVLFRDCSCFSWTLTKSLVYITGSARLSTTAFHRASFEVIWNIQTARGMNRPLTSIQIAQRCLM
jgi:hypothetical protein